MRRTRRTIGAVIAVIVVAAVLSTARQTSTDAARPASAIIHPSPVGDVLLGDEYAKALGLKEVWDFPVYGCQAFTFGPSKAGYCADGVVEGMDEREVYMTLLRIHGAEPTALEMEIWDTMDRLQALPDTPANADQRRELGDRLLELMTQLGAAS